MSELATAKSSVPSPLKSPTARATELKRTVGEETSLNVPSPFPNRMLTVLSADFATARSRLPSPLKSAITTAVGFAPTVTTATGAKVNVPSPLPSRTVMLLSKEFATTRSSFPSPLRSSTANEQGQPSTAVEEVGLKVPSPLPSEMSTLPGPPDTCVAIARSSFPSPLKSAVATELGSTTWGSVPPWKIGEPGAWLYRTVAMGATTGKKTTIATAVFLGFATVTCAVPAAATFAAGTSAFNWELDMKVVASGMPFQRTIAPETKPVPCTVRTNPASPGATAPGRSGCVTYGTGFCASA